LIIIALKIIEIIVFIVASEKPKTLKVTSLQLTIDEFSNCFRSCSLDKFALFPRSQTKRLAEKTLFNTKMIKGYDSTKNKK